MTSTPCGQRSLPLRIELKRLREAVAPELRGVRVAADELHEEVGGQRELIDALDGSVTDMDNSSPQRSPT